MKLLQPSSFTDLLELLPGGISKDPEMNKANFATLREVGMSSSDYAISSLGTAFVIDGIPVMGNSSLQSVRGAWETSITGKNTIGRGIDMRSLSTDGIERIEIIRGIPSVTHGDLTNGVIDIKRSYAPTGINARLKMDSKSKLAYAGAGISLPGHAGTLNIGVDYFASAIDPRNSLENFTRINGSLRYRNHGMLNLRPWSLSLSADYNTTLDEEKSDIELLGHDKDYYKQSIRRTTLSAKTEITDITPWYTGSTIQASYTNTHEDLRRQNFVQLSRPTAVPNTSIEGEHEALILPYNYIAVQQVEGKPTSLFARFSNTFTLPIYKEYNSLLVGAEYRYEKNRGAGHQYDMATPPSATLTTPPRAFSDIPALQQLALFAEEQISATVGAHHITVRAGLRAGFMPGMDNAYSLAGKWYVDPRVNLQWQLPHINLLGAPLHLSFGAGIGYQSKAPVLAHLYPDPLYFNYTQLNYFHEDTDKRLIHQRTYRVDPTNFRLSYSRNLKKELRTDIAYRGARMEVIYFREKLNDGFRSSTNYRIFDYKKYDASAVTDTRPDIAQLPYTEQRSIQTFSTTTNGSSLHKEGVEYQLMLPRMPFLNSRITVSGAWLRSVYLNSQPLLRKPTKILDGKELQYLGVYTDPDGYTKSLTTTTFVWDSHLPRIGMNISLTAQAQWRATTQRMAKTGVPSHYIDIEGNVLPYTATEANHAELQWLTEYYTDAIFRKERDPIAIYFNLKATKRIYKGTDLSLFVNRFTSYLPDYESNGYTIRRHNTPYFGMELNINI
ncbi:MAG: hypothetical protein ACRDDZ_07890 [Marinifilaceae bacterium]